MNKIIDQNPLGAPPSSPKTSWTVYAARFLPARVRRMHANHKRIARGFSYVMILSLVAKGMAALKEMAVAWRYGTAPEVDAYLLSMTIATWLPGIISSVGIVVLVPLLVRPFDQKPLFMAELSGMALMLGLIITILTALIGPAIAPYIMPATVSQVLVRRMLWQLSPLALLTILAGILSARLQAQERFGYTFMDAIPALSILVFILFWPFLETREAPLVWGVLIGTALQVAWLGYMTYQTGWGGVAISCRAPQWKGLSNAVCMMTMGFFIYGLTLPLDQIFAARIGPGAIAMLGYANRLILFAAGLGTLVLSRALLPVLSDIAARGEYALGRKQTVKWSWLMMGVFGIVVPIGWALAPWGVALLFERGAFTSENTAVVSNLLRCGLLQLPPYVAGIVLGQWFIALNRYGTLLIITAIVFATKVGFNLLFVPLYATAGLMLATSVSQLILWILLMIAIRTDIRDRTGLSDHPTVSITL